MSVRGFIFAFVASSVLACGQERGPREPGIGDVIIPTVRDASPPPPVVASTSTQPPPLVATEIACETDAEHLGQNPPELLRCPPSCARSPLWGTDLYTTDSSICTAARHAGAIDDNGGIVAVTLLPGRSDYVGSVRNGVSSDSWGPYERTFTVRGVDTHGAPVTVLADAKESFLTCTATPKEFTIARDARFTCPAGCTSVPVWGTDLYTDDSSICGAAVHAGVIGASGGNVRVIMDSGAQSYKGSVRNGVTSNNWGAWTRSFRVAP